jgi:F420-dependent oxidoreductase-like protein
LGYRREKALAVQPDSMGVGAGAGVSKGKVEWMRYVLKARPQMGMSYRRIVEVARAAEDAGFEAFFRSDHWRPMSGPDVAATDAWTTLAGLARETTRIRLGTLVSPVTLRGPYELAKIVATVDEMSDGRVELGIGAGWLEREHEPIGIPLPPLRERFDRLAEQLEIIDGLWARPSLTFGGHWYSLRDAALEPKPVQRPRPTVILGGTGKQRGFRLAARWADEYDFDDLSPAEIASRLPGLRTACQEFRRGARDLVVSAMTDWPLGDADAQRRRIDEFAGVGVERIILDVHDGRLDLAEITRFGRDVIGCSS